MRQRSNSQEQFRRSNASLTLIVALHFVGIVSEGLATLLRLLGVSMSRAMNMVKLS